MFMNKTYTLTQRETHPEASHVPVVQVTTEEDLEIIFSRFGKITSCDIIRDYKTGAVLPLIQPVRFKSGGHTLWCIQPRRYFTSTSYSTCHCV